MLRKAAVEALEQRCLLSAVGVQHPKPADQPGLMQGAEIDAVQDVPWQGTVGTFIDDDAQASDYQATLSYYGCDTPYSCAVSPNPNVANGWIVTAGPIIFPQPVTGGSLSIWDNCTSDQDNFGVTDVNLNVAAAKAPAAPIGNLTITQVSIGENDLSWPAVADTWDTEISLCRWTDDGGLTYVGMLDGSTTTFQDTNVEEGVHYTYEESAYNKWTGESLGSNAAAGYAMITPPTNVSAAVTEDSATVFWQNMSANATGGCITCTDNGPNPATASAAPVSPVYVGVNQSYTFTGLEPGENYTFAVAAGCPGGGLSAFQTTSASTWGATLSSLSLDAITGATMGQTWSGAVADFSDSDIYSPASNYAAAINWGDGNTTTGLIAGGDGSFQVDASYAYQGFAITPLSVTITDTTQPAGQTGSVLTATSSAPPSVALGWTSFAAGYGIPNASNQVGLEWGGAWQNCGTSIDIEQSTDGGNTFTVIDTVDPMSGSYIDTTVQPDQTYTYCIVQADDDGNAMEGPAIPPAEATVTTPTAGVANLAAAASYYNPTSEIDLTWTAGIDPATGAQDASGYNVYRSTDAGQTYSLITPTPLGNDADWFGDTDLTPDTSYSYQVTAIWPAGESGPTVAAAYTLASAPTGVNAVAVSSGEVDVTWQSDGTGSGFDILRADAGTGDFESIDTVAAGATTYQDTSVEDGGSYQYEVAALSSDPSAQTPENPSTASAEVDLTPNAPTNLTAASDGAGGVSLQWTDNSQDASGVNLFVSSDGGNSWSLLASPALAPDATSLDDASLSLATAYQFYAVAVAQNPSVTSSQADTNTASFSTGPSISFSAPGCSWTEGTPLTLTPDVQYAPGTTPPSFHIDWGDGSSAIAWNVGDDDPSYTYYNPGNYTIAVTSDDGSFRQRLPLQVGFGRIQLTVGGPGQNDNSYSATVTATYPPGHPVTALYADFGDGDVETLSPADPNANPATFSVSHAYAPVGFVSYCVTLTAVNDQTAVQWEAGLNCYGPTPSPGIPGGTQDNLGGIFTDDPVPGFSSAILPCNPATLMVSDPQVPETGITPPENYIVDWGDGDGAGGPDTTEYDAPGNPYGEGIGFNVAHTYTVPGQYTVRIDNQTTGSVGIVQPWVFDPTPQLSLSGDQIVAAGQPVDMTATFADLNPNLPLAAFVDWDNGSGPQPVDLNLTPGSGLVTRTIAFHLDHAPATAGGYTPSICIYDPTNSMVGQWNTCSTTPIAWAGCGLDVWSATLGDGTNNDVLAASPGGTLSKNQQVLTLNFPHPFDESFDITLNTTDAADDNVWWDDDVRPETGRALGVDASGSTISSCTFSTSVPFTWRYGGFPDAQGMAETDSTTFLVGATAGNTSYDCLQFSFSAVLTWSAPGCGLTPPNGPAESNSASNIGMVFQAPVDENGNPIMTVNNPDSPTPTEASAGDSSDGVDDSAPTDQLTEVDLIYPSDAPAGTEYTLTIDPSVLRMYDDANGDNLVVGSPTRGYTFGPDGPTALYAELSQNLTTLTYNDAYGAVTFACNGASAQATPVGVGISVSGLTSEDPDAIIPYVDPCDGGGAAIDPTTAGASVNLELPMTLPVGTTVTLSIDPSMSQALSVYDSTDTPVLGLAAGGATSVSWTVTDPPSPPQTFYALSAGTQEWDGSLFTVQVQLPGEQSDASMLAMRGATPDDATTQPTTVAAATQGADLSKLLEAHKVADWVMPWSDVDVPLTCAANEPDAFLREYINSKAVNKTTTLHPIWSQTDGQPQPGGTSLSNPRASWVQTDLKQDGGIGSEYTYDGYIRWYEHKLVLPDALENVQGLQALVTRFNADADRHEQAVLQAFRSIWGRPVIIPEGATLPGEEKVTAESQAVVWLSQNEYLKRLKACRTWVLGAGTSDRLDKSSREYQYLFVTDGGAYPLLLQILTAANGTGEFGAAITLVRNWITQNQ